MTRPFPSLRCSLCSYATETEAALNMHARMSHSSGDDGEEDETKATPYIYIPSLSPVPTPRPH